MKGKIQINIQKSLDEQHQKETNNAIIDYFVSKTKLEAPLSMIENYMEYIIQDLKQRNPELDEEQAKKEHEGTANKNVKWYLIKLELIKTNKISVSI